MGNFGETIEHEEYQAVATNERKINDEIHRERRPMPFGDLGAVEGGYMIDDDLF
jgi:hypothetical protein